MRPDYTNRCSSISIYEYTLGCKQAAHFCPLPAPTKGHSSGPQTGSARIFLPQNLLLFPRTNATNRAVK